LLHALGVARRELHDFLREYGLQAKLVVDPLTWVLGRDCQVSHDLWVQAT
jgi:hypothetical protein